MHKGLQESKRALTPSALTLGQKIAVGLFDSSSAKATLVGVELAGTLKIVELEPDLLKMLKSRQQTPDLRRAAAVALAGIDAPKHTPALAAVVDNAD